MTEAQLDLGEYLRDQGIRVVERNHSGEWTARADDAIEELARRRQPFTADDVREHAGDPPHPNLLGARFQAWARKGRITHVGYQRAERAERHASVLSVWRGA